MVNSLLHPNIDMNYLGDQRDLDDLVDGLVILDEMVKTKAFQASGAEFIQMPIPRSNTAAYPDKAYFSDHLKDFGASVWHPSCTCPMGQNKNVGVVDARLQVFGIKRLRVVDASM